MENFAIDYLTTMKPMSSEGFSLSNEFLSYNTFFFHFHLQCTTVMPTLNILLHLILCLSGYVAFFMACKTSSLKSFIELNEV